MSAGVAPDEDQIMLGECLELLPGLPGGFFSLIYLDPPFNTGTRQARRTLRRSSDRGGDPHGLRRADATSTELLARPATATSSTTTSRSSARGWSKRAGC